MSAIFAEVEANKTFEPRAYAGLPVYQKRAEPAIEVTRPSPQHESRIFWLVAFASLLLASSLSFLLVNRWLTNYIPENHKHGA